MFNATFKTFILYAFDLLFMNNACCNFSIVNRYEEIVKETYSACGSPDEAAAAPNTCQTQTPAQPSPEGAPSTRQQRRVVTLSKVEEEDCVENGRTTEGCQRDVLETVARKNDTEQDTDQRMDQTPSSETQSSVASESGSYLDQGAYGESET